MLCFNCLILFNYFCFVPTVFYFGYDCVKTFVIGQVLLLCALIMATDFIEENPTLYEYRRKRNNYMVYCAINIFIVTNFTIIISPSKSEWLKVQIILQCLNICMYIKSKSSQNLDDTKQCSSQIKESKSLVKWKVITLQHYKVSDLNT